MSSSKIIKSMNQAFVSAKNDVKHFVIALGFDIVLVVLFGFVSSAYFEKMFDYLVAVGAVVSSAEGIRSSAAPSLFNLIFNQKTIGNIIAIVVLMFLVFISIYFLFCFLAGISTYISFNLENFSKKKLVSYVKKFLIIMIPWSIILGIREIVSFHFYYMDTARQTLGMEKTFFRYIDLIVICLIIYFMLISFIIARKKNFRNSFKTGIKNPGLFGMYLMLLAIFGIIFFFSRYISQWHLAIGVLYEVGIVLGFIVFARVAFKKYFEIKKITA